MAPPTKLVALVLNRGYQINSFETPPLWLSLLGREEETDSDNRAFLYLYGTTLRRVERQNRGD
jgi:hypothetical protein